MTIYTFMDLFIFFMNKHSSSFSHEYMLITAEYAKICMR
jgi:hypothetical protein